MVFFFKTTSNRKFGLTAHSILCIGAEFAGYGTTLY